MKHTLLTVTLILATAASAWAQDKPPVTLTPPQAPPSAEQELQAIQQLCGLADYASRPFMVVNTASLCGYTPQYAGLQDLWTEFHDRVHDRHRRSLQ